MSTRALAEQFDVARGTVRAAVERMVEEKYLITRRGIGTFTNPSKAFCRLQKVPPKLIGIKMQGGDQFFLDPPAMRTLAALLEAFSRRNFIVRFLNGSAERGEDSIYELEHAYVDGIVACDAPCADRLHQSFRRNFPGIRAVRSNPHCVEPCSENRGGTAWRKNAVRVQGSRFPDDSCRDVFCTEDQNAFREIRGVAQSSGTAGRGDSCTGASGGFSFVPAVARDKLAGMQTVPSDAAVGTSSVLVFCQP